MTDRDTSGAYTFDGAGHTDEQLATLGHLLDPVTIRVLSRLPLPPTARCLELGAGGGSIVRWLAHRLQPPGQVVAADLDVTRLTPSDTIEVRRHDLRDGSPDGGPWDLIHARLVLLHLPHRRRLLRQLAQRLAPGGWLVLGEFSSEPLAVLTAPHDRDAELFGRVIDAFRRVLAGNGADLEWAWQVHPTMVGTGLVGVHTQAYTESWAGGGAGARLHHLNSRQTQPALLDLGVSEAELDRFRVLVADPVFAARSWQLVCTRGQRPSR
jgi:SAM-dependent methyltransferase